MMKLLSWCMMIAPFALARNFECEQFAASAASVGLGCNTMHSLSKACCSGCIFLHKARSSVAGRHG